MRGIFSSIARRCLPVCSQVLKTQNIAPIFQSHLVTRNVFTSNVLPSSAEEKFKSVLMEEIKLEKEQTINAPIPENFSLLQQSGSTIKLIRDYKDGMKAEIEIELSGSVGDAEEGMKQDMFSMEPHSSSSEETKGDIVCSPEFKITLRQKSDRAITFSCSFPDMVGEEDPENSDLPNFSVDTLSTSDNPDYFIYPEILDDKVYEAVSELLMERGFDVTFQNQLLDYCHNEEHKLYINMLESMKAFCSK